MDIIRIFGIICEKETNVILSYATHTVSINGFIAHVDIEAEYINHSKHKTDAKFVFPLEEDSAVYKFEAKIGDKHLVAKCKDKETSQKEYDEAVQKGKCAILLRETSTSGDIFEYSLGNIQAKQKITLQLALVCELSCEVDGAVKFYMPFVLNPRYGITPEDEKYKNAPSPREFSFNANIHWPQGIEDVKSEHPIKVEHHDKNRQVCINLAEKFNFDKYILFYIHYKDIGKPQATLEKGQANAEGMFAKDVVMVTLFPKLPQVKNAVNQEYIFIVDTSGSMTGDRIEAAKDTLMFFLKSLPLECAFNIISFSSNFKFLFKDGSKYYNEESMNEALKFQKSVYAAGGTEILAALKSLSHTKPFLNYLRQVFLLTDGGVYDTKDVIQFVKLQTSRTRFFTVGIGSGASTELVKGIARAGRGQAEFVVSSDNLKAKVIRLLKLSMQPFVSEVCLSAKYTNTKEEFSFITVPENIPTIFTEERLILYLVIEKLNSDIKSTSLNLSGKIGKSDFSIDIDVDFSPREYSGMSVHRLCVRKKIQELELKEDYSKNDEIKPEIIQLGTMANIASRYTSFVASEEDYEDMRSRSRSRSPCTRSGSRSRSRSRSRCTRSGSRSLSHCTRSRSRSRSPCTRSGSRSPCTRSGSRSRSRSRSPCTRSGSRSLSHCTRSRSRSMSPCTRSGSRSPCTRSGSRSPCTRSGSRSRSPCTRSGSRSMSPCTWSDPEPAITIKDKLKSLTILQRFSGYWELDQYLATVLNNSLDSLLQKKPSVSDEVWATALAIVLMREKLTSQRCEWELLVDKAIIWLESQSIEPLTMDKLLLAASNVIKDTYSV